MPLFRSLRAAAHRGRRRPHGVDLSHRGRSPLGGSVVRCVVYHDGVRQLDDCTPAQAVRKARRSGGFVWMGLYEPTQEEFSGITELFGLHPLAVEDAVHAHQRPKIERYDDTLFTVLKTVAYVAHERLTTTSEIVSTGEIMVFTGPHFVLTVRHGGHSSLGPVREELEGRPGHLALGPMAVLHAIVDHVVDQYLDVTDAVQDDVDAVETDVFSPTGRRGTDAGRIYQLKRELLELKRAVVPLVRPLLLLTERSSTLVGPEIRNYFRDVGDHLYKASEQISSYEELLNSILQANIAQVTVTQNEDMRKITAWAAIIAVPTLICGVYGMNFDHMPELHWMYGYPIVIAVMITVCLLIHRGFRRNGWL